MRPSTTRDGTNRLKLSCIEEWSYNSKAWMTCQHFQYSVDAHCHTLLECNLWLGSLQDGEHLTQCYEHWSAATEMKSSGTVIT